MMNIAPAVPGVRKARPFRLAKLPANSRFVVLPMILSFLMSGVVASIATIRALGLTPDLATSILKAWAMSYAVAFPSALVVMPIVRWIVDRLVEAPGGKG
ncbi:MULTISPECIES: DUF2798 domain-containing protein [Alphaproteobacteria]|uniref:DUF2798 domain-containing protein n=2 Tax=Alphaproteobacteria TaxID=28211 RepID=A0A512HFP6_9HYPH|nr:MULTISPECIES: DUF2798 domain-containing protein [Alphaproteobacteria]GEO84268.1 hypothetical protein RNA01_12000 [Ciceribacter naphthalenivorans]GLR24804.1 hypothetical protein GCM10007920_45980 [Ciceribacter naphthalenivorans]GLT07660.1 hypothetical protein GCM10007926_45980 [Sphingomonas psychrolutea]